MNTKPLIAALVAAGLCLAAANASAQIAGSTTTAAVSVSESTQIAMGWSVKKTLLGKAVYNDAGDKIGKVQDLIVAPDRNVSYLIVGAGGFIGIGRHDVAIPVSQVQSKAGKLVMPGATKDMIKALPAFDYATDTGSRDRFVARTEQDLSQARTRVSELQKKASAAGTDAKAKLDLQITAVQVDLKSAEGKLGDMKSAAASRWKEFEADVTDANARLRKSLDKALA